MHCAPNKLKKISSHYKMQEQLSFELIDNLIKRLVQCLIAREIKIIKMMCAAVDT